MERLIWQRGEVIAIKQETADTHSITFHVAQWPGHKAGQHVDIRLTAEDGYQASRSYSIASPPEAQDNIMLTVERLDDGEVSPYLVDELRVGDLVELRGPIGGYFVWDTQMGGPLLLAAGGSGIVPLMAMLRHRAATASSIPTRLLYSSRSYEDIIYRDELASLNNTDPNLEVIQTLSRHAPDNWPGYTGRFNSNILQEVIWPATQNPLTYICGPTAFVEAMATGLVTLAYPPLHIRTERFGPT